jgi:hypothetical protein
MTMAIGVYFGASKMTSQQYDDVIKKLDAAGVGSPKGRLYHASFGDQGDLHVFDVWTSQAEFDAFGAVLMPILADTGLTPAAPQIMPIYNVIKQ